MRRATAFVLAALLGALAVPAAQAQIPRIPIPGPLDGPLPRFTGAPAAAQPLPGPYPTANPALAPDGRSGSGLAAGNGGASPLPGPLGHGTTGLSSLQFGTCASLAFDAAARLLALCNGPLGPQLRLIDPNSLATLSVLVLPPRLAVDRADRAGGTHFIVRADGTLLVPTHDRKLLTVVVEGTRLRAAGTLDLGALLAKGERPFAVAAGFDGHDWVAGNSGALLAIPRGADVPRGVWLREPIAEDVATSPDGVFAVTASAAYRVRIGATGVPEVVWRRPLLTAAGTPPAILPGGLIAFSDGPSVRVLRAADGADVCRVGVFAPGAGRITAHLVVAGRSIVAANAHGYDSPFVTEGGRTTTGGLARVDVEEDGCHVAWTSREVSPSAQSVVSRATGLLYTLVKPAGFPDAWNLAAIDWRTGATRFAALAGEGLGHNSEGGAVVLGPDGAAYAGTFGGVVRFRG